MSHAGPDGIASALTLVETCPHWLPWPVRRIPFHAKVETGFILITRWNFCRLPERYNDVTDVR